MIEVELDLFEKNLLQRSKHRRHSRSRERQQDSHQKIPVATIKDEKPRIKLENTDEPHEALDLIPTKIKAPEIARGGGRGPFVPPPIFSVHRGVVKRVQDFGAFVEISELGGKWGLVHWAQLINQVHLLDESLRDYLWVSDLPVFIIC